MRWEKESIKEGRHWKQGFLKRPSQCRPCAVIWSVLTELSRGMEKIIHRNVWGALKRSRPRDWPIGARLAERQANFFLMNSAACSTMQSDCQSWTPHMVCVWRVQMTGPILPGEKRGWGVAYYSYSYWLPLFFYLMSVGCGCVACWNMDMIWLPRKKLHTTCWDKPTRCTVSF